MTAEPIDLAAMFLADDVDVELDTDNLDRADWAIRKLGHARKRRAFIVDAFAAEIARLISRRDELLAPIEGEIAFFADPLARLHERLLADDPKRKTINLPNGTLKARKVPATFEYPDEAAFVEWAINYDVTESFVRYRRYVDKAAVKKAGTEGVPIHQATGEVAPGIEYVPESVSYTVETA